jgi:hypothetical protein
VAGGAWRAPCKRSDRSVPGGGPTIRGSEPSISREAGMSEVSAGHGESLSPAEREQGGVNRSLTAACTAER